jgi:large subunit ribosomal protein L19e
MATMRYLSSAAALVLALGLVACGGPKKPDAPATAEAAAAPAADAPVAPPSAPPDAPASASDSSAAPSSVASAAPTKTSAPPAKR